MNKGKLFYLKISFIILPLLVLLSVYVLTDPFKVIYSYHFENYYDWQHWELNREVAGVENLKERLNKNDVPNAFIFGNSRSTVFHCDAWESFLKDSSKPFHFDAAGETLYGVYKKVMYLENKNIRIKDALLVCDVGVLAKVLNEYDVTHIKHPDISGESKFAFQANFIKCYFTNFFCVKQIDFLLFGKVRNYMRDIFAINPGYISVEPYKNDYIYQKYDAMLKKDSVGYYVFKRDAFFARPKQTLISDPVLKNEQIKMLKEMKRIFDKDNTRFKLVVSPHFNQENINPADLKTLTGIFGSNNVFDYSGKNEITECKCNFYEGNHYKPYIANNIMSDIYSK